MEETKEELLKKIAVLEKALKQVKDLEEEYGNREQATKLIANSAYGAFGQSAMLFFNVDLVEAITLQAKETNTFAAKFFEHYFKELWYKDTKLHEKLGIKDVKKVSNETIVCYQDTDSVFCDTLINNNLGIMTIEDLFNKLKLLYDSEIYKLNKEIINLKDKNIQVLNYENNKINYSNVKKIIRHKVTKPKWKLKSKLGKEIIITADHSLIVFRNGEKIVVKPNEVNINTDKILTIYK